MLSAQEAFYIEHADITVNVKTEGRYEVTEKLDLVFTESRHGFYRTIPSVVWMNRDISAAQDGSRKKMMRDQVSITDINVSAPFQVENHKRYVDLRVGSPNEVVSGPQSYEFQFTIQLEEDRVPAADMFFYSLWGSGWDCEVREVTFRVNFEEGIPASSLQKLEVYAGDEGNVINKRDSLLLEATEHTITGRATGLGAKQAVTVVVPLPQGYFALEPDPTGETTWFGLYLTLLLLVPVFYVMLRRERVTSVLSFYAPKGLDSAVVGSIYDGSIDDKDLLSLIPQFAADGYLRISQNEQGDTIITKLKDFPTSAPEYQQLLFNALCPSDRKHFNLSHSPNLQFAIGWHKAKEKLASSLSGMLNKPCWWAIAVLALAIFFCSTTISMAITDDNGGVALVLMLLTFVLFILIGLIGKEMAIHSYHLIRNESTGGAILTVIVCLLLLCIPGILILFDWAIFIDRTNYFISEWALLGLFAITAGACVLCRRITKMTKFRKLYLGEVMGLREFIDTADRSRLEALLNDDGQYFYKILPYAMNFGMVDKWAAKFEGLRVPCPQIEEQDTEHLLSMLHRDKLFTQKAHSAVSSYESKLSDRGSSSTSGSSYSSSSSYGSSSSSGGYSGGGHGGGGGRSW